MRKFLNLILLLPAIVAIPLQATPSDDELLHRADAIVRGTVQSSWIEQADNEQLVTHYVFQIDESLKTEIGHHRLVVTEEGGSDGRVRRQVLGTPFYEDGATYLLFLRATADGRWEALEGSAAVFKMIDSENGPVYVRDRSTESRTAERFEQYVRARLAGAVPRADYRAEAQAIATPIEPHGVPSRYTTSRTGTGSAGGAELKPIRWADFPTPVTLFSNGSVPHATDEGLHSLLLGLQAWTQDPSSNVELTWGGTTAAATAAADGINAVLFNDPEGEIPGSYVRERFEATGAMAAARTGHSMTRLDDGRILTAGGMGSTAALSTAELYTSTDDSFAAASGSMNSLRTLHTATKLLDGTVLLAAGSDGTDALASAELFDPTSGTFSSTSSLGDARQQQTATPLGADAQGKVLITGGSDGIAALASAELYDPNSQQFTATGSMAASRYLHTATLVENAFKVLVAGGHDGSSALSSAELYDRVAGTFSPTAGNMTTARLGATATPTSSGVLIAGGSDGTTVLSSAEIFDETTGTFSSTGSMNVPRTGHQSVLLQNGNVLIVGGNDGNGNLASAEVYDVETGVFYEVPDLMSAERADSAIALLADGNVLISGGAALDGSPSVTAEIYVAPISTRLVKVHLYTDGTSHDFAGISFWSLQEADIVVQDGLSGVGLTNGGLDQLMTHAAGLALAFDGSFAPSEAVLNPAFSFDAPPFASNLQPYDREGLAVVYPTCPTILREPESKTVSPGGTALLTVEVTGGDLSFEWYEGTAPDTSTPVGTDSATFTTPNLATTRSYWVRISNNCGSVDSATATVSIGVATAGFTVFPTSGLATDESGGSATFVVALERQPTADVVIGISSGDATEGFASPSSLTFTPGTWSVEQTVTVTGVDDAADDGDVDFSIITTPDTTTTDLNYNGLDPEDVTITNRDDDTAGVIVNPTAGLVTSELGTTAEFTIVLRSEPEADVSFGLSSSDATEASVSPASATFTPGNWSTAQTIVITGVDDAETDGDIPFEILTTADTTTGDALYNALDPADVTGINIDDDGSVPGDVNGNGSVDPADIFYLINHLFAGGPEPLGDGDANSNGAIDTGDIFFLINYLFAGGPAPS